MRVFLNKIVSFLSMAAVFFAWKMTTARSVLADGPKGGGSCSKEEINTAIGCIPVNSTQDLIGFFLTWAVGIAGGIAFLFIGYASFILMTSSGDPKKTQAGKELLTSAISGLLFLLFSVFILRIVGVDILGIGELTK